MTTTTSALHPHRRDAAVARIDRITTGTAALAVAATAGFGVVAAFTYAGQPSPAATTATTTTSTTSQSAAGDDEIVPDRLSTTDDSSAIGAQLLPAPVLPRAQSGGTAQVTTGGSR